MKIGGFLKQSLIDYPGKIASVIFTSGCNFSCFYCHNPELVLPDLIQHNSELDLIEIYDYLNKNKNLLDAVVITGGEPTIHKDLPDFISQIKNLGLAVKLDTNGTNPKMLNNLLKKGLIDYLALDIKAPISIRKYREIVGDQFSLSDFDRVLESIHLVKNSQIDFEFRTTLIKPFHSKQCIKEISENLIGSYYLQEFNSEKILKPDVKDVGYYSFDELTEITKEITNDKLKLKFRNN